MDQKANRVFACLLVAVCCCIINLTCLLIFLAISKKPIYCKCFLLTVLHSIALLSSLICFSMSVIIEKIIFLDNIFVALARKYKLRLSTFYR